MQAKNLEELELQQPFFERTLRPLAGPAVRRGRADHQLVVQRTHREAAWRWPATRATCGSTTGSGIKAIGAIVGGILFFLLFGIALA